MSSFSKKEYALGAVDELGGKGELWEYINSMTGELAWKLIYPGDETYMERQRQEMISSPFVLAANRVHPPEEVDLLLIRMGGAKTPQMADALEGLGQHLFGRSRKECFEANTCVTCGGPATEFEDDLSKREYRITCMCQKCQDSTFGKD